MLSHDASTEVSNIVRKLLGLQKAISREPGQDVLMSFPCTPSRKTSNMESQENVARLPVRPAFDPEVSITLCSSEMPILEPRRPRLLEK